MMSSVPPKGNWRIPRMAYLYRLEYTPLRLGDFLSGPLRSTAASTRDLRPTEYGFIIGSSVEDQRPRKPLRLFRWHR